MYIIRLQVSIVVKRHTPLSLLEGAGAGPEISDLGASGFMAALRACGRLAETAPAAFRSCAPAVHSAVSA